MNLFRCMAVALVAWCFATLAWSRDVQPQPPALVQLSSVTEGKALAGSSLAWIDPDGSRDIEAVAAEAPALPWSAFEQRRQYRIDGRALWLRFDAAVPTDSRWFLVLMHPSVDLMQLYYQGADGRWVVQAAGQDKPVDQWSIPGRLPTFELAPGGRGVVRYWVRIEHERANFSVPIHLYSQPALLEFRAFEQFLLGAYFGVLAFIGIASLVSALVHRDRNFTALLAYVVAVGAVQLVVLGVGAQHLWVDSPHWSGLARRIVPGMAVAACLWFVKVLSEPARFSRALDLACWSIVAALLAAVALNAFIATRASFALVAVLIGATVPIAASLLALAWRRGRDPYMGTITLAFVPLALTALLPIAYALNLLPNTVLTRHGLALGTALQLPILYYALSRRALQRRETHMRAARLDHTDALTGLCDRDTLLRRLEDALMRAIGQRHLCAVLGVRLTNYEALRDEFGRAVADRALVVAASILRSAARDLDLPARVGERDFILLLDGPTTAEAAVARAQQVVAHGLQHAAVLPPSTTLKFHVALTLLPDQELDARRCLQWLEEACNAMRSQPRRAIRAINF
ncbi:7TM diverse intracellular signaling domain-containing protein [Ramlibacter sp. AN1015]|uniref:sensor domain-containing diguanylate cyclase n=1 Tax=Ramlibacter sp. AN1015 TaxID=3133428 RepID=UPI0030BA83DC